MKIKATDSIFRVKYQHRQVMTVFAPSFAVAVKRAAGAGFHESCIRSIRLASRHEIREYFGGLTKVPAAFKTRADIGQNALAR